MRRNLALVLAAAAVGAGFLVGCGSSSDNDDDDDDGELITSGTGGSAGSTSSSGSGGKSGGASGGASGGSSSGGTTGVGTVGAACTEASDCGTALVCLDPSSTMLGGSPPGGLCTATCATHDDCLLVDPNAACVEFSGGSYCVEVCEPDPLGPNCHNRLDFACAILGELPGTATCVTTADCTELGTFCAEGLCTLALTACMPLCGNDLDCTAGQFCDHLMGMCVATQPTGKDFGADCDPAAAIDAGECLGFCTQSYDDPLVGSCSGFCNLGNPLACGYTGDGPANAACLFATVAAGNSPDVGDLGFCGQLCDCNSDCTTAGEYCRPWDAASAADLQAIFMRDGYCVPLIPDSGFTAADSLDCDMGAGGAGPVPPAGGAGGAP